MYYGQYEAAARAIILVGLAQQSTIQLFGYRLNVHCTRILAHSETRVL